MTLPTLAPELQPFYEERLNKWSCKKCNNLIKGSLKNHQDICTGLPRRKLTELENEKMAPFYRVEGKQWFCLRCHQDIKSKRPQHSQACKGIGTRRQHLENIALNQIAYSNFCEMGCGLKSAFFHKNGKAYCCKFGAKCPIKVANDKALKDGIDPFKQRNIPHPRGMLGKTPYNKGKKLVGISPLKGRTRPGGHHHSEETKAKLRAYAKLHSKKGYFHGGGKGKQGRYKAFWCDSSWELAYILYCEDHNIQIERYTKSRTYVFENKTRIYWPDFLVDGVIVEIKGYKSDEWKAKHEANPDIKVLSKEEMAPILKYVRAKYGKDFIRLYESREKPDKRSNEE